MPLSRGVIYLDKPLKKYTLWFQTITRTNRPWRNPRPGKTSPDGMPDLSLDPAPAVSGVVGPANSSLAREEALRWLPRCDFAEASPEAAGPPVP